MDSVSNTIHGLIIDVSMSDGGTYSRGSSILTYVAVSHIVDGSTDGVYNMGNGRNIADLTGGHFFVIMKM
jgi:hypothetical protein